MDFNQVLGLVRPELIVVIVACYMLGLFLKNLPKVKDWIIPLVLLCFAIVIAILYIAVVLGEGFTAKVFIVGFIQGLICASIAVYGNEVFKQLVLKRPEDTAKYK